MCCWTVKLLGSREEYDATLVRKDRKEQRRKRRNLAEKLGEVVLVDASSHAQADEFFETLKIMRAERFKQQGRRDILRDRKFAPFYQAIASDWQDFVSLSNVQAGGKTIAAFLALRHANNYALIMHSFAADIEKLSPGIVALDELISRLIHDKLDHCDFTIGNEPYKRQFGVKESAMLQGIDPVTPRGIIFGVIFNAYQKLRLQLVKLYRQHANSIPLLSNSIARPRLGASSDA
jgi:CelD/BcsL family acetyltransferase involved in cellulose biosynthesis